MGDKIRKISIDDYILGSLMLYTDIIRIFMKVLKILQELNKKKDWKYYKYNCKNYINIIIIIYIYISLNHNKEYY